MAILRPHAREPVVVELVLRLEPAAPVGGAVAAGDLGQEDRGLGRLALAEQDAVLAVGAGRPSAEQLAGVGRDPVPVARPPPLDLAADVVDQGVLLAALAGGVEVEGAPGRPSPFFVTGIGMNDSLGRRPGRSRRWARSARARSGARAGRTAS